MLHSSIPLFENLELLVRHGGYWVIYFISMIESTPLLGAIIPGQTIIILGGFFAKINVLNVYMVMFLAALGAIVGDIVNYWLGLRFGEPLLNRYGKKFFIQQSHVDKARALVHKHTAKAIIIGRFSPITRAFAPFFAGVMKVPSGQFWVYNIIGGILWAVISVLIGYVFGASYQFIEGYIGKLFLIGLVLGVLIIWGYNLINRRRHIFTRMQFYALLLNISMLYVFSKTIQDALSKDSFLAVLDVAVNAFMSVHEKLPYASMAQVITIILSPTVLSFVGVVLILWCALKKKWGGIFLSITTLAGGVGLNAFLKLLIERDRPENALIAYADYSFPSGHAMFASLFFGLVIVLFTTSFKSFVARELFVATNIIAILAAAGVRVFLNVHWLSDVVAGVSLGIFWLTLMILLTRVATIFFSWDMKKWR